LLALLLLLLAPLPVRAQPADGVTEKLIQILVKNGVLTKEQADSLLEQARAEARAAHPPPAPAAAAAGTPAQPATRTVRVTYVPETVRRQIAAEVKQDMMQQAQDEGWAEPSVLPEWTQRIKISGDVRLRGENDIFPRGNSPYFPDFNAINTSSNGFDVDGTGLPPLLNTTEDRTRVRLRARLDVAAQVAEGFDTDIRIATGSDSNPVSTNQTLGATGDFQKYALWLDRAYIRGHALDWFTGYAGRMPNPFWTSNLLFDDELNFDGIAGQARIPALDDVEVMVNLGAFPVFNTAFNLGTTNVDKTASRDSYLLAAQAGGEWKADDVTTVRAAAAWFDFTNVEGKTSALCIDPTTYGSCSTDGTRVPFLQFGNTLFPIRDIGQVSTTSTSAPEFYGLAARFGVLDLHGQLTYTGFHPVDVQVEGDFIKNLEFNRAAVVGHNPANNLGSNSNYEGGDTGYMVRVAIGHLELRQAWDWNVSLTYKYIESDAAVDALTDSLFHLGGTNAKGFVLAGSLGLAPNVTLTGRWYSTNAVSGAPYSIDTFLIDLGATF
jgi:hypothetical protein